MKQKKWIAAAATAGTVFSAGDCFSEKGKPDILLIIADDLGPQLGCYGDATVKTPFIDQLAAGGVRFTRAHVTAASSSPSRGSIMTGLYPHQHGMYSLAQQGWAKMHDDVPKLPNELKKLGYRTGLIGKTHFEPISLFEFDYLETNGKKVVMERDVRWMNSRAEGFLNDQPKDQPFFLVVSYVDPHRGGGDGRYENGKNERFPRLRGGLPENPPAPEDTVPIPFLGVDSAEVRLENSDYYSCVQRLDTGIGELLAMMKKRGSLDNTLILFIGDHGPDITRGKISAYASATHIPMIVNWKGHMDGGQVRDELVSSIDIFPTFVDAAGGKISDERQTGRSLLPLLKKGSPEWRTWLGTEFITHVPWHYYPRYTVFSGDYHFIHNLPAGQFENPLEGNNYCYAWWEVQKPEYEGTQIRTVYDHVELPPEFELFNLKADPYEFKNLADEPEYKIKADELSTLVRKWREQTGDPFLSDDFAKQYQEHAQQQYQKWLNRR